MSQTNPRTQAKTTVDVKPSDAKKEPALEKQIIAPQNSTPVQPESKVAPMKEGTKENAKAAPPKTQVEQALKTIQPVISEDETERQNSMALEKNEMLPETIFAEQEKKEVNSEKEPAAVSPAFAQRNDAGDYKTISQVVNGKIKSILGIGQENNCGEENEKLTWWDLAMAAKQGIQNIAGSKAVDINKKCDGKGEKAEYVFAAGNFEIAGKFSK